MGSLGLRRVAVVAGEGVLFLLVAIPFVCIGYEHSLCSGGSVLQSVGCSGEACLQEGQERMM